jgi:hypothetical protein
MSDNRICTFIESPYSGKIDRNVRYLKLCKYDSYVRNEMPCSSHDDMTQHPIKSDFYVSDYEKKWDIYTREEAINASHFLRKLCNKTVFYIDLGWSSGMKSALEYCKKNNLQYEIRNLNYENVLSLNSLITHEFIDAIVKNKPYSHFLEGTLLEKN